MRDRPHHVFTYANAVHQALKRIDDEVGTVEAVRGLLHGAMALYLARFLNVPPASLPGESGDGLDEQPVAAEEIRAAPLDTFNRQQQIGAAAYALLPARSGQSTYSLSQTYVEQAVRDVALQLGRGGVRLSLVLNRAFAASG